VTIQAGFVGLKYLKEHVGSRNEDLAPGFDIGFDIIGDATLGLQHLLESVSNLNFVSIIKIDSLGNILTERQQVLEETFHLSASDSTVT
jgi:hypothetical protein